MVLASSFGHGVQPRRLAVRSSSSTTSIPTAVTTCGWQTSGLAVYALDLRGRGRSDGERFYFETFADYARDVATTVKLAKSREPGVPIFLLGHSAFWKGSNATLGGWRALVQLPSLPHILTAVGGVSNVPKAVVRRRKKVR